MAVSPYLLQARRQAVVAAARAARQAPGGTPEAAEAAAQATAARLGVTLPGEDFCLHGLYQACPTCEEIFG